MSCREASLFKLCPIEPDMSIHVGAEGVSQWSIKKVNLILNGNRNAPPEPENHSAINDVPDTTYSTASCPSSGDLGGNFNDSFLHGMSFDNVKVHPSSQISQAIDLYFQYCHRQPIWCFDREEIKDLSHISEELVCSILTLTSRFSKERDEMLHYGDTARTLVMLRIANGTVELETIESLCLLAYSSFN
ncbi:hypothetical protein PENDEC_c030G00927 [Penicillium decumbens]|uniref:Uncharacterized protein n=1 Tax=Penicillium decumbens TaxID=69771 RepID=A0A1V6NX01_PENDC|nr:hypothetical protein PENDEC_c030G00927 [Penicillium decumbens]